MRLVTPAAIVLDTTPLGLLTQRDGHLEGTACRAWAASLVSAGCLLLVPEIADYETRRELMRLGNAAAIARLNRFIGAEPGRYLPLTTPAARLASELWGEVRRAGRPTASPDALDGDVLISAQARIVNPADYGLSSVLIATANVGHMTSIASVGPMPRVLPERWADLLP